MASIEIRDRLLAHDPTLTHLELTLNAHMNLGHSVEALRAAAAAATTTNSPKTPSPITHVTLHVSGSWMANRFGRYPLPSQRQRGEAAMLWSELNQLFEALSNLPKLQVLNVFPDSFGQEHILPATLIARTLRASNLQRFKLHGVHLSLSLHSPERDLEILCDAIRNHPSLVEISIVNSMVQLEELFANATVRETANDNNNIIIERIQEQLPRTPFSDILTALSTIPHLESLGVHHCRHYDRHNFSGTMLPSPQSLLPSSLSRLTTLTQLQQLEILNFSIGQDHLISFSESLVATQTNNNLQELSLSGDFHTLRSFQAIHDILLGCPVLETLYLENDTTTRFPAPSLGTRHVQILADALRHVDRVPLKTLTLEKMYLQDLAPLVEMMEFNCRLEALTYTMTHTRDNGTIWDHHQTITFLLKLNAKGRYALLNDAHVTRQKWVDAISNTSDDINCLFYLLLANPLLCQ